MFEEKGFKCVSVQVRGVANLFKLWVLGGLFIHEPE